MSVIVPTYNRRDSLLQLLEGLRAQTMPPDQFEVVVAIDGSSDGTVEALEQFSAPFVVRSHWQENSGRSAARNAGLALSSGQIVVLLDDDLEPEPDFLAALVRMHQQADHLGVLAAVRYRPGDWTPFADFWLRRFEHFRLELESRPEGLSWSETYSGGFSVRRADLVQIGGFETAFDGYGLEDFEVALRLVRSGVELRLCPEAVSYHLYDKTFEIASRDAESRGRSAVIFGALHPDIDPLRFAPRDAAPPSLPRRLVRYLLPRVSPVLPIRSLTRRLVAAAERRRYHRLGFVYTLALEYFFLVGLREASRDAGLAARGGRP